MLSLYPPMEPHRTGWLPVDDDHTIYWEESGNPKGIPVLGLHGGPGGGSNPKTRRYFDPNLYRIILFDQRGSGKSLPFGDITHNTTEHLVHDIDRLRHHFKIKKWLLFGSSWGSTLALVYGQRYPESCLGFILRGIFLARDLDINWFTYKTRHFYPEAWNSFVNFLQPSERHNVLAAYFNYLMDPDPSVHRPAARSFRRYEAELLTLLPKEESLEFVEEDKVSLGAAKLGVYYFLNKCFLQPDQILKNMKAISALPAYIIQGRYDMLCPPLAAYELSESWPNSKLSILPCAGHSSKDPGIQDALVDATHNFALRS